MEGSSSGHHHDFHDNLYILLRGKKRFRLFSPDSAEHQYTNGKILRVFPNGRIVYEGPGAEEVQADGSERKEAAAYLRRVELEAAVAEAERAVEGKERGGAERLKKAEEALDAFIEQTLEAAAGSDEDADADLHDDFDDGEEEEARRADGLRADREDKVPDHFSKINLYDAPEKIAKKFPKFPGVDKAAVAEVSAGEMLYLPAGWFHEVESRGVKGSPIHLAFNYWFHPPTNLVTGRAGFEQPYKQAFWPTVHQRRQEGAGGGDRGAKGEREPEEPAEKEERRERKDKGGDRGGGGKKRASKSDDSEPEKEERREKKEKGDRGGDGGGKKRSKPDRSDAQPPTEADDGQHREAKKAKRDAERKEKRKDKKESSKKDKKFNKDPEGKSKKDKKRDRD